MDIAAVLFQLGGSILCHFHLPSVILAAVGVAAIYHQLVGYPAARSCSAASLTCPAS